MDHMAFTFCLTLNTLSKVGSLLAIALIAVIFMETSSTLQAHPNKLRLYPITYTRN